MPLAVKRLNNLPIMEVKYSLLKMHVSLRQMPFGSLQTLTTLSQSLEHRMVLAGQLHRLALYHALCPDSAKATQRREVGTVQGGCGTGPLVSPEEGRPRPENF